MGTIVKFKPDVDYYYSKGLAFYESERFADALKCYREAYGFLESAADAEFRAVLEVEMALCYRSLHLVREAQSMYYKALGDSGYDAAFESVLGLIEIFGTQNKNDALRYYMDYAAKRRFSRDMDYIDAATQFFAQRDYQVEPSPEQNMLELGKKLIEAGQYDFAKQLLEVVPPESEMYTAAAGLLTTLYYGAGEYDKALASAKAAAKDGETVETQVATLLALDKSGRKEEAREILDELDASDYAEPADVARIVRAAAMVGDGDLLRKYGRKLYRLSPQRAPMISYAVALANDGQLREARTVMVSLQALYPYDGVVRVYSRLIAAATEPTNFPLTGELPDDVEDEVVRTLNEVLDESEGDRGELKSRLRDPSLRTGVLMILQVGSENSKRILYDVVAEIPYYEKYMRDCLLDPGYPETDKRIMLPVAIRKFRRRPVWLTCHDVCRPLYGKPPARIGSKWREAYCLAYGTIALFGYEDFEKDFDETFDDLLVALGNESNLDEAALAALLVNRIGTVSALRDTENCIELFDADRDTFMRYKNKLNKRKGNRRGRMENDD